MTDLVISVQNLNFGFGRKKIINNLNLQVTSNAIYGFLGPNGAGKTTTIKLLLGLLNARKGVIYFNNCEFSRHKHAILQKTGALIENPSIYGHLTARENLSYLKTLFNLKKEKVINILELVGLLPEADKKVKHFSHGMKQRLGIAMSLIHDPEILILDEPFNGLDPIGFHEFRELLLRINAQGKTIFLSSHLLSEIEKLCTHVGIINKGALIYEGKITGLLSQGSFTVRIKTNDAGRAASILAQNTFRPVVNHQGLLEASIRGEEEFNRVISLLVQHNMSIYNIEKVSGTLENLFVNLTKK